ncbi:hypothetical protein [Paenibacillus sp. N3.4]|uniref:hypothetical protein n=1 Tax=Paenibacillus sp. N3.4 TaxID=2603222 RepID=UPI00164FDDF7|nr:hypothetical protein [Paenibacillus sp. N3.4]
MKNLLTEVKKEKADENLKCKADFQRYRRREAWKRFCKNEKETVEPHSFRGPKFDWKTDKWAVRSFAIDYLLCCYEPRQLYISTDIAKNIEDFSHQPT